MAAAITPPELRDYQKKSRDDLQAAYRAAHRAVLFQLATGGGKTIVFAHVTTDANARGHRVLILVHLRELITQASAKLTLAGVPHGIIAAGLDRDHGAPVLIASIQTLNRRQLPAGIRLIVIDEAHHCRAKTYMAVLAAFPTAWVLGVTATPQRLDGKGLGMPVGPFSELVLGPPTRELVAAGWLSPIRCFSPAGLDREELRKVHKLAGDYAMDEVEELVNRKHITGNALEHYRRRLDHQPTIVFCVSIKHAEDVAEIFRDAGYRAACVHGGTPKDERERLIYGLCDGTIEVLTNCVLISEGVDVPEVSGIILLRPTSSLVMHRQQIGRGMRPGEGKVLIVNDHVGNIQELGHPEVEPMWQLNGIDPKDKGNGKPPTWECHARIGEGTICGCVNPIHAEFCQACRAPRPSKPIELPHQIDGRLAEFTLEMALRQSGISDGQAQQLSIADLIAYAEARGYNDGWLYHKTMDKARHCKTNGQATAAVMLLRQFAAFRGYKRGWVQHVMAGL